MCRVWKSYRSPPGPASSTREKRSRLASTHRVLVVGRSFVGRAKQTMDTGATGTSGGNARKKQRTTTDTDSGASRLRDRVALNVGGTVFQTTWLTLTSASTYFAAMAHHSEFQESGEDEIFLDRDPDVFKLLLTCMRAGRPLLPEEDLQLCTRALLEAEFLGMDTLLDAVKQAAYFHMHGHTSAALQSTVQKFDAELGGLEGALRKGVLPARFFTQHPLPPPPRLARSFTSIVEGYSISDDNVLAGRDSHPGEWVKIACGPQEVVYIQSAVLAGAVVELRRYPQKDESAGECVRPAGHDYATEGTYLACTRRNGTGDFQLQLAWTNDNDALSQEPHGVHTIAHRGLDFVQNDGAAMKDLQFRETLNLCFDRTLWLRGRGLCEWHVQGWVGYKEAIPGLAGTTTSRVEPLNLCKTRA